MQMDSPQQVPRQLLRKRMPLLQPVLGPRAVRNQVQTQSTKAGKLSIYHVASLQRTDMYQWTGYQHTHAGL